MEYEQSDAVLCGPTRCADQDTYAVAMGVVHDIRSSFCI